MLRTERLLEEQNITVNVSIVVPAYNAAGTVGSCIDALKEQRFDRAYEVIVVDDGSNDETAELAEAHGARVIRSPHKRGAAAARNLGIAAAKGELICFTDADCAPREDWLQQVTGPLSDPEIVGAKGTYATRQKEIAARFVQIEYEDKYDLLSTQERINFVDTYSAAYRRDILVANDGFDENIFYVEDQELSFRLAARGYQMVFQAEAVVYHYHSNNLSSYFHKKFMIGYWKAQILRRFPGRVVQDSHTPQVLKLQILLAALILASTLGILLTPWSAVGLLLVAVAFLVSTIPFLAKSWPKDRTATLAAPTLLAVRALALGFGYFWGLIKARPDIGEQHTIKGLNYLLKRFMDIVGALLGLFFTLLIWPILALAIKLDSQGPVIFKQERVGEEGRPFTLYKFRSMYVNAEKELPLLIGAQSLPEPVLKLKDDPRLTRVGRTMRRWSLDELPQFWNVLKGNMSLVGPRPEETGVVALYDDWHRRRLAVKPGMTGPMQVNGRGDLPLDVRVRLDLNYIENYSIWRDVTILLQTIPAVVRGSGAY